MPASTIRSAQDRLSWRDLMLASTARTYAGAKWWQGIIMM